MSFNFDKDKYAEAYDNVKLDGQQKARLIYAARNAECEKVVKPETKLRYGLVGGMAAVIAVVMLFTTNHFGLSRKGSDGLLITANLARITTDDYVKIDDFDVINSGACGGVWSIEDEDNPVCIEFSSSVYAHFNVKCEADGLSKITYRINGDGYFAIKYDELENISDKVLSDSEFNKPPDDAFLVIENYWDNPDPEHLTSFTVDYEKQDKISPMLELYYCEEDGEYCDLATENCHIETFDDGYEGIVEDYDAVETAKKVMTENNNFSVDITLTYENGETETKTMVFDFEVGKSLFKKNLDISAKLI